jgi:hypothetical protein
VISLIRDDDRKGKKYDRIVSILLPLFQQGFMIFNKKEESSNDHQEGTAQLQGIEPGYNCHDDAPDADHGAITKLSNEYNPGSNAQVNINVETQCVAYLKNIIYVPKRSRPRTKHL